MGGQGRPVGILTYPHIKAETEALACSDDTQAADCKSYFAGFAQMLDLLLATDESTKDDPKGLCGDLSDLVPEFIHAVRTEHKYAGYESHMLLFGLLTGKHACTAAHTRIQTVSAGRLLDTCHLSESGFQLCSQYEAGALSALLFVSEQTRKPLLCGDSRLVDPVPVSQMLNEGLQADFALRASPAVAIILSLLKKQMPCPIR